MKLLLDTAVLGEVCHPRKYAGTRSWFERAAGTHEVLLSEVADYEPRRWGHAGAIASGSAGTDGDEDGRVPGSEGENCVVSPLTGHAAMLAGSDAGVNTLPLPLDVELFDLKTDPFEMKNLAAQGNWQRELVLAMNEKLNRLIDAEVGDDLGQMLPGGIDAGWAVTPETMAP